MVRGERGFTPAPKAVQSVPIATRRMRAAAAPSSRSASAFTAIAVSPIKWERNGARRLPPSELADQPRSLRCEQATIPQPRPMRTAVEPPWPQSNARLLLRGATTDR